MLGSRPIVAGLDTAPRVTSSTVSMWENSCPIYTSIWCASLHAYPPYCINSTVCENSQGSDVFDSFGFRFSSSCWEVWFVREAVLKEWVWRDWSA